MFRKLQHCIIYSPWENECHWYSQPSIALAYSSISQPQNYITFWEISICGQGQRRTACLNVTPVWTAKGSILRLSKLELGVMQCHYSRKAGHGCWGTVQNVILGELKSFYLSKLNAVCRKYPAQCPFHDLFSKNRNACKSQKRKRPSQQNAHEGDFRYNMFDVLKLFSFKHAVII